MTRLYMVAAEPSGDILAAEVIDELTGLSGELNIAGVGGDAMAERGIISPIDIAPLSIVGIFDGLKIYRTVLKLVEAVVDDILKFAPDAVILVDSWGFMVRVADRVRARAPEIKLIKLVGPQVWATRAGRAKKMAAKVDHMIAIHDMEVPYYEPHGLPVTVMGNPALYRAEQGDGQKFRQSAGISSETDILLVLPGSREGELRRVAPTLVAAAKEIKQARPETEIIFAPALAIRDGFQRAFEDLDQIGRLSDEAVKRADLMRAATLALACSGTVTSELAVQGTPFLVGYKGGWLTWFVARFFLYKPDHITLLNIAADDREIAPEFLQTKFKAQSVSQKAIELLEDKAARDAQVEAQNKALSRMRGKGDEKPQLMAARAILEACELD
ncbi:MAG: lipid-A-disaccharide synthase [Pseudomonadota bacterium]